MLWHARTALDFPLGRALQGCVWPEAAVSALNNVNTEAEATLAARFRMAGVVLTGLQHGPVQSLTASQDFSMVRCSL